MMGPGAMAAEKCTIFFIHSRKPMWEMYLSYTPEESCRGAPFFLFYIVTMKYAFIVLKYVLFLRCFLFHKKMYIFSLFNEMYINPL